MSFHSASKFNLKPADLVSDEAGFTLLEVLVVMIVMGFISLGIFQAITETYKLRDALSNESDFYNGIRLSMDVIQRDVTALYSPAIMIPNPSPSSQPPGAPAPPTDPKDLEAINEHPTATQYWGVPLNRTGIRPSHFIGTENKMSFISADHQRIYKDSPESIFAKVSYEINHDDLSGSIPDTSVLTKTESPNVWEEDESKDLMKRAFSVLRGIKVFKIQYYRKDKDRWEKNWDSDKDEFKNIYPDIVEISIEVVGPTQLSFTGKFRFRPEIPLHGLNPST